MFEQRGQNDEQLPTQSDLDPLPVEVSRLEVDLEFTETDPVRGILASHLTRPTPEIPPAGERRSAAPAGRWRAFLLMKW
jgi:hypothetical protein